MTLSISRIYLLITYFEITPEHFATYECTKSRPPATRSICTYRKCLFNLINSLSLAFSVSPAVRTGTAIEKLRVHPSPPSLRRHTCIHESTSTPFFLISSGLHGFTMIIFPSHFVLLTSLSSSTLWLIVVLSSSRLFVTAWGVCPEIESCLSFGRFARVFLHLWFCVENYQYAGSFGTD
jgi:hypothetical protein